MVGTTWAQPASASATPAIALFVLKILNIGHSFGWSSSLRQDDSTAASEAALHDTASGKRLQALAIGASRSE